MDEEGEESSGSGVGMCCVQAKESTIHNIWFSNTLSFYTGQLMAGYLTANKVFNPFLLWEISIVSKNDFGRVALAIGGESKTRNPIRN